MNFNFSATASVATLPDVMHIKNSYLGLALLVMLVYFVAGSSFFTNLPKLKMIPVQFAEAETSTAKDSFYYPFRSYGVLEEAGSMSESPSPYFWVNSGALLKVENGIGKTNKGSLSPLNYWRNLYGKNNPLDTSDGKYPQNLFRLVTKSKWDNVEESVKFQITRTITTDTPNRDGYSGVLLFSRYKDGDNLYYAGIRQDGESVIKKKKGGSYTTLASGDVFSGSYDKYKNPNLIPEKKWMELKSTTKTLSNGSVEVTLYLDGKEILKAVDSNNPITGEGHAGIRTDYMDVEFDDLRLKEI